MPFYVRAHLGPIGWSHRIGGRPRPTRRSRPARKSVPSTSSPPVGYVTPAANNVQSPAPVVAAPSRRLGYTWVVTATKAGEEPIEVVGVEDFQQRYAIGQALSLEGWRVRNELREMRSEPSA